MTTYKYPPLKSKIDPFIPLALDPEYKPRTADPEKIKGYVSLE